MHNELEKHRYDHTHKRFSSLLCPATIGHEGGKRFSLVSVCRRAQLRHCLEQLKQQVPLSSDSSRNTTLNLLRRAQMHIKVRNCPSKILNGWLQTLHVLFFENMDGVKKASVLVQSFRFFCWYIYIYIFFQKVLKVCVM